MPEQLSVAEFLEYTKDDIENPSKTTFVSKLGLCRGTIAVLEEMLETDRSGLSKMKKSVKALASSGKGHAANEVLLYENLERLGANALSRDNETELGAAFLKFAVVTKELSNLLKNLVQSLENIVLFPLDSLLKGDIKGRESKKTLDKAIKELEAKLVKVEKEKKQIAKLELNSQKSGQPQDSVNGSSHQAELERTTEEIEKDRRFLQLQLCEFLLKVNEVKTKKGCELLQHLVEFYHAQSNFFQDGLKTVEQFQINIGELKSELHLIHQRQDAEKRKLNELKTLLKSTIASYKEPTNTLSNAYSVQPVNSKGYGSEKTGVLLKKSEGKMRRVWQRRKCMARGGFLHIYHSDESQEPTKLNLLTCQVKLPALPLPHPTDDSNAAASAGHPPPRRHFDLVSSAKNRTYHFQTEDDQSFEAWISVLNNSKEEALQKAFGAASSGAGPEMEESSSVRELRNGILDKIRQLPGNGCCCDCGTPDPEWLSTNLGVLVCLECCGIHRDLGVHISRTQSTAIDNLGTAQLLVARAVGNALFNEIFEATLPPSHKLTQASTMESRSTFIRAKYCERRYAIRTASLVDADRASCRPDGNPEPLVDEDLLHDLKSAVVAKDISGLLQCLAEGVDLFTPLLNTKKDENALHLAIESEPTPDGSTLHLIDFLIQNKDQPSILEPSVPRPHGSNVLDRPDAEGNTPLHLCANLNRTEAMKLLLRYGASLSEKNAEGATALDIAKVKEHSLCCDLLEHAGDKKSALFENVNVDWDLDPWKDLENEGHSFSDDDLDHSESSTAHNRQSPACEKRRRLLSTLSNASRGSGAPHGRPISCATPTHETQNRRPHTGSDAQTSSQSSPVLTERKRSHTSDSIINAAVGVAFESDASAPKSSQEECAGHSTPSRTIGCRDAESQSRSATLSRPKSGHGTLKKRPAPQPPSSAPFSPTSAATSYATPLRKNPMNSMTTTSTPQRKSGSVSEGEETILSHVTKGKPGRTNSAIYSNSLPRSHVPARGDEETKKDAKGKPPLIVFLPDGKGYVLPPFRDIQQENVTEKVMEPVVWDSETGAEDAQQSEGPSLPSYDRADQGSKENVVRPTTARTGIETSETPLISNISLKNSTPVIADLQRTKASSATPTDPPHKAPMGVPQKASALIESAPAPQKATAAISQQRAVCEDDAESRPQLRPTARKRESILSTERTPASSSPDSDVVERRKSVDVESRRKEELFVRRKSSQDLLRSGVGNGDSSVEATTKKVARSVSEALPPKDVHLRPVPAEKPLVCQTNSDPGKALLEGSPCRRSAEGAVQAARMMFEKPAPPVYNSSVAKPSIESKPVGKISSPSETFSGIARPSVPAVTTTTPPTNVTLRASVASARAHFLANDAPRPKSSTFVASSSTASDSSQATTSSNSTGAAGPGFLRSSAKSFSLCEPLSTTTAPQKNDANSRTAQASSTGRVLAPVKRKAVFPAGDVNRRPLEGRVVSAKSAFQPQLPRRERVRSLALYDCDADNDDELQFKEGDVILVLNKETEDDGWWEGQIEGDPSRRGIFPFTFVQLID